MLLKRVTISIFSIALFLASYAMPAEGASPEYIRTLKDLCLNTELVKRQSANAVIVAPGSRYRTEVGVIQQQVHAVSGVTLPVYDDTQAPEHLLGKMHVIVLGNMATNVFIERLYRQWQVILDLKYPGEGGYVVRSLHNPYGTGFNVIFVGGSDDKGVEEAARVLVQHIRKTNSVNLGWLLEVKLGKDVKLPEIKNGQLEEVYSWQDSWRMLPTGKWVGYKPATYFGWNPISVAGMLYYMTGQKKYIDYFKTLAMPEPGNIPIALRTDDAFTDPHNPLVKNYHYRSHMLDCVFDLIEESPLFTDKERIFLTNKLVERQYEYDPNHTYSKLNPSRHESWHMINIYLGSRYFSKYYPNPVWNQRIENVRRAFDTFINNPTWGERDTLEWVSTSIEPVFEFFLIDGYDTFVKTGTAGTMMKALEILMTGDKVDYYNKFVSIGLLHKAAYMLKDSRYIWMVRQLGFDFTVFRIGQSYWPSDIMQVVPPADITENIQIYPLAKTDWMKANEPTPFSESFQLLSYRTGLAKNDDYFLVDGFEGLGRNPYHVNTLLKLRMFNGKNILDGYENGLNIWFNGMSSPSVAKAAAIKNHLSSGNMAYVATEVPSISSMKWERHLLHMKNRGALVIDKLIALKEGAFDIISSWRFGSNLRAYPKPSFSMETANGVKFSSSDLPYRKIENNMAQGKTIRIMQKDEDFTIANMFSVSEKPLFISDSKEGVYIINEGSNTDIAVAGNHSSELMTIKAKFAYFDYNTILVVEGTELTLQNEVVFKSDKPATFLWELTQGKLTITPTQDLHFNLSKEGGREIRANQGDHILKQIKPKPLVVTKIVGTLKQMELKKIAHGILTEKETAKTKETKWKPVWVSDLKGKITNLSPLFTGIWAVAQTGSSSRISKVAFSGGISKNIPFTKNILSIWSAEENRKGVPGLLVGLKDDTLRAFSENGEPLWTTIASIHESFKTGNRYVAPWFTDPHNVKGIYSILVQDVWGKGKEEIVIGRPSTLEFHELDGSLIARVPTRWGNNTSLSVLKKHGMQTKERLLLAGKFFTGNPQISGIINGYKNVSDKLFDGVSPGFTTMHAWLQRGLSHLMVADINKDGVEEIIFNLSGHWNELRVYSGSTAKPLWMQYFGPDKAGSDFMRALVIADLYGDGYRQVIVATKNGWVCAFDYKGQPVWQQYFSSGIRSMANIHDRKQIAVGCEDGTMATLDKEGRIIQLNVLNSSVNTLLYTRQMLFVGTEKGLLSRYTID